ncbi:MAG TPA: outer membrane beta-barrel protein [Candidatus Paceibacterota bacterium]|nr:outer membrane beta-barrel protein [Verrucomicrobiota bacterium]HRY47078.1 outer membrane beta-barrel protein [Candidatus Paceibacterota bacterium]HSA00352.1 outer membrane beta-barrel protein [Candidatus Paceibacterota bacterium]
MKKIITSASIIALGTVGLHAAYAPGLTTTEKSKFWSVSATLRGFYDDNYMTQPSGPAERDSFGVEVSPALTLNFPMDQTLISAGYIMGMRWYEDRDEDSADWTHQVSLLMNHAFSENYKLKVSESFVIGQEPGLMNAGAFLVQKMRVPGNNIMNAAGIDFDAQLSRLFSLLVGYANNLYDYDPDGDDSYSAYLDRLEHMATVNLRYQALPNTIGILGYQFGVLDYTSDYTIGGIDSDYRNSYSHYFYLGVDQTFTPELMGSIRLGGQFTDYNNLPSDADADDTDLTPYADASITWAYNEGSNAQLGVKYSRIASDMASLDQSALSIYGSINHAFTAKLRGSLLAQYQNSEFNEGPMDSATDDYFLVGANLSYQISRYLATEVGYNFDSLDSDVDGREFDRNRVYLGIRASY